MALLADILSSRARAEIFRLLLGLTDGELHVREIERRSGLAFDTIRQELKKLASLDLLRTRRDGNRLYYRANTVHPLYNDIRSLVLKTVGLRDVLADALGTEGIELAFVFGSLARGDAGAGSDVDLMVIGDVGLRELSGRLAGVGDRIGRVVNPHVFRPSEFRERRDSGDHFVASVLSSPRLFVVGTEDELRAMG